MLPATLVTLVTFVLDLSVASPVYNMQPAFITTNIGSTNGRNIRNLPCVSRKNSNLSGVCMFAIDCLKANGTHLGTCIDRFYFGSCCHIEPMKDIETNIILDNRVPPVRRQNVTVTSTSTVSTTINRLSLNSTTTSKPTTITKTTTTSTTPSTSTTITKTTTTSTTPSTSTTTTTAQPTTTTTRLTSTTSSTTTVATTTAQKLQTFQQVDGISESTTPKVVPTKTSSKVPPTTTKPRPAITAPSKKPTKATKPNKSTAKPSKPTTSKPSTTKPTKRVTRPATSSSTVKTTTKRPTVSSTTSTTVTTTTAEPVTRKNISQILDPIANEVIVNVSTSTTEPSTTVQDVTTIELTTINAPSGIWIIDDTKNHTTNQTVSQEGVTEEWQPITTPDGWVLLPSVAPLNVSTTSEPASTSTSTTTTASPSTTVASAEAEKTTSMVSETTSEAPINVTTSSIGSTTMEVISDGKPVNMSDFTDVCGRRMWPEARIVGGEKSAFGRWPWQISLRQWRTSTYLHKCGAALLNENWAITAAHCVDNVPPSDLLLRLGEHDLLTEAEPYLHEERRVQIVASHPQFDARTFEYDLALLRFYEPVQFQPNILPVCVPKTDENFVGRTAYVTGWGRLYEEGPLPSVLQEVTVPVINNTVCESMYRSAGYIEHIPHIFICAGWRKGGYDSCEGDSGGPMVIQREDKRFLLAGVISWGIGCAEPNQPGVYTRISEFRDWINQILQF